MNDDVVWDVEVRSHSAHDTRAADLHGADQRATHFAAVREPQVDDDVGGVEPSEELLVGDVGHEMDTTTKTARGDNGVRVPGRDPPADEREIHVRVTSVDGVDDGRELLGRIQVSGRDDQHVVA